MLRTVPTLRDERIRTEVQWTIASLALSHSLKAELPQIARSFLADQQKLLEGVYYRSIQCTRSPKTAFRCTNNDGGPVPAARLQRIEVELGGIGADEAERDAGFRTEG